MNINRQHFKLCLIFKPNFIQLLIFVLRIII